MVSASAFQAGAPRRAPARPPARRSWRRSAVGEMRIERQGNQRWLSVPHDARAAVAAAARLLAGARLHAGRSTTPQAGVMETDWAENRAKLPQDIVRSTHRQGARLAVRHRRARPVPHPRRAHRRPAARSTSATAAWTRCTSASSKDAAPSGSRARRPAARSRVAVAPDGQARRQGRRSARRAVANAASARRRAGARARASPASRRRRCRSTTASTAPGAASAWRSTAAASRSKTATAPAACTSCATSTRSSAGKEEPGFFAKLFSFGKSDDAAAPVRYRVAVKGEGDADQRRGARTRRARPRPARPASASSRCWSTT